MREEFEYLSDEQLQSLIDECENGNIVSAPLGFSDNVLELIAEAEKEEASDTAQDHEESASKEQTQAQVVVVPFEQKLMEYRRFRLQVSVAVAAAVLFLVVSPFLSIEGLRPEAGAVSISELGKTKVLTELFGQHNIDKKLNEKDLFNMTEGK